MKNSHKFWLKKCLLSGLEVATHGAWLATGSGGRLTITNPQYSHKDHETKKTESGWPRKKKEYQWLMSCIFLYEMLVISSFAFVCMLMWGVMFVLWIRVLPSSARLWPKCLPVLLALAPQPSEILEEISRWLPVSAIVRGCTGMCIDDYLYDVRRYQVPGQVDYALTR